MSSAGASYWNVPRVSLGQCSLPRLFLGDHGFLALYDSILTDEEVEQRMRYALSKASIGLSAGDERCLNAAVRCRCDQDNISILYHTDIALRLGDKPLDFSRCMSSLSAWLRRVNPRFLAKDPIMGGFLQEFTDEPYSGDCIQTIRIDTHSLREDLNRVRCYRPDIITIGGDYLDFALALGLFKLAADSVAIYKGECEEIGKPLAITTYLGACFQPFFSGTKSDALMLPVNSKGLGMLPDRDLLLLWARGMGAPVIAMHTIGSGSISIHSGLTYAFKEAQVDISVVGASREPHIDELIKAARSVLSAEHQ